MTVKEKYSPNYGPRPDNTKPTLLVLHGTAGQSDAGDVSWCCDPKSKVSYHYIVGRDGQIYQLVPDEKRAWHAGDSTWQGARDCNNYSIGIGFSNNGTEPFTQKQYEAGKELVAHLRTKHSIPWARVVGHQHISPGRKTDPWLHFEWLRLV